MPDEAFRATADFLGHESLLDASILHRDISIGNVMLNMAEDDGFLIDLDLAIKTDRKNASGAPSKTGTKVFMAIGALYGEDHSFMHDLESFFWVLFWACVHCTGPGGHRRVSKFQSWNFESTETLAKIKKGLRTINPLHKRAAESSFPRGKAMAEGGSTALFSYDVYSPAGE